MQQGRLHGEVAHVHLAGAADAWLVACEQGLALVERDADGVELLCEATQDGAHLARLRFRDAPARWLSGEVTEQVLDEAALACAAYLVGLMDGAFERTLEYLKVRRQFGREIGSFQALQHRMVDLRIQIELSRAMVEQAAAAIDAGASESERQRQVSSARVRASEAALLVTRQAIQLHGGIGYTDEADIGLFCAGGDLGDMRVTELAAGRARMQDNARLVRQMVRMGKPLIAAVEGWAVGAGLSVALACDSIVCGAGARFAAGFGKVGLLADLGQLHTLPARIGWGRARQILMFGQVVEAEEALRIGLADRLCAAGGALAMALELAGRVEQQAPLPLAMTKALLAEGLDLLLEREGELQSQLFLSADHAEGKAAFLAKRPPVFRGN
nr:enoyl-CoA hydratase-related protein [Pseudomonas aeruginosa]